MLDLCLDSKKIWKSSRKIHHVVVAKKKVTSLPKKKVATSENFTTSEEVDKGTKKFDDMKEAVITILRKDLDHFEG